MLLMQSPARLPVVILDSSLTVSASPPTPLPLSLAPSLSLSLSLPLSLPPSLPPSLSLSPPSLSLSPPLSLSQQTKQAQTHLLTVCCGTC